MKKTNFKKQTSKAIMAIGLCLSLSACGSVDRLANIGQPPPTTPIENPQLERNYRPVSMPMPAPTDTQKQPNSLWAADRTSFFKDQRANDVGDILTVMIDISDEAEIDNESSRSRSSSEDAGLDRYLGLEASLGRILPEAIDNTSLIDLDADSSHTGSGEIEREESITVELAAMITQILPNGNFVIHGKQEVLVNFEKRILRVDGIIRPEDVSTNNTINHQQIAEARIVYGGEGQITDVQQPRYGQQAFDVLFPF